MSRRGVDGAIRGPGCRRRVALGPGLRRALAAAGVCTGVGWAAAAPAAMPVTAERVVVILAPSPTDDRLAPTADAIAFWNGVLAEVGAAFRLAAPIVRVETSRAIESYARRIAQRAGRLPVPAALEPPVPAPLAAIAADIILLLSRQDVMSYAWALPRLEPARHLVVIRRVRGRDRGDPMVTQHVVAHELGHTFGLLHNDDPHTLMCGPCQPLTAESDDRGFLPLTAAERRWLAAAPR